MKLKSVYIVFFILVSLLLSFSSFFVAQAARSMTQPMRNVVILPLKGTVDHGMKVFLFRALQEAEKLNPAAIILEMDTPGGMVDEAIEISQRLISSSAHTIVFVQGQAASAGSFLALSADEIAMAPGSAIGSAALVDRKHNYVTDPKQTAFWSSEMKAVAQKNGRNPKIACAMTDLQAVIELKELNRTKNKGELLALSTNDAKQVGYAEYVVPSTEHLLAQLQITGANKIHLQPSFFEKISSYMIHPVTTALLLFIGITGVAIELLVPGFGIPGLLGIAGFGLYFFGHYIAGLAGMETFILFIIGLILLVLEIFIPSFGTLAFVGSLSLMTSIIWAAYTTSHALLSLGIACIVSLLVVIFVVRIYKERGVWNKFILQTCLTSQAGFVANMNDAQLIGKTGYAATLLRPAGLAIIEGKKYDVVTAGTFINRGEEVKVMQVEGIRIIVEAMIQPDKN